VAGDVVVADDHVLLGSRSYDLIALDAATGEELWKHYWGFGASPVIADGVAYAADLNGRVSAFALS
jgi:outer membrane protein assembly factor BamB